MVTSASISIAGQESGQPFFYLERQLLSGADRRCLRRAGVLVPTELWRRASLPLLRIAIALLLHGAGARARALGERQPALAAARRTNFQVSELARVLVLIYVASYAVRRESELRASSWAW